MMDKLNLKEAIVVEGRYDKNALSQVVESLILQTDGFRIFKDKEQMALLRQVAQQRGLLVLTDSDGAGFVIRNRIASSLPKSQVKHGYIPDIVGKERRKVRPSKEGLLGVEGMSPQVLREILQRAGASFQSEQSSEIFSTADFLAWGLTGDGSGEKREVLLQKLGLPSRMSKKGLQNIMSSCYTREEILDILQNMEEVSTNGKH